MASTEPSLTRILIVLGGLALLSPLALDAFLPAVNDAAVDLNTTIGQIMMSWGILSIGSGIGQIIHGPLSDRFGRKPIIIGSLITYFLTSILSILVESLGPFYVLRFVQGFAMAATMILMRAVVRDLYSVRKGAKIFANLFVILAAVPVIAPIISGHLTTWFGWKAIFIMMASISGIVLLIIVFFLDESLLKKDVQALNLNKLKSNFIEIISERNFITFLLIGVGAYIGLFAILTGIAPVMVGMLNQTAENFGYQFGAIMTGHLIAAAFTGKLIEKFGIRKLLLIGISISLVGGISLFGIVISNQITVISILLPSTVYLVGFALTIPGMTAGALSNFQHMAGRATSLLGFIQQGTGAIVAVTLSFVADGSNAMPVALVLVVGSLFAFIAFVTKISKVVLQE
ncbi:MAG: multidrug effflux MFS transporter [Pseudomonadota bacterium]|nr:multidrug effflux MFS transporter [Pseudomonadota bacterium]